MCLSLGFIYFHLWRPLPYKGLYFYVHYFATIFEFLSFILEGRLLWEWRRFRTFLWIKPSFFPTACQSQSYRKHWEETQEKERRKVRTVSTKCWDNARLLTVSLFFLLRRAKRARHANEHARDWRRETRHGKRDATLFFFSGCRPRFSRLAASPPDPRARAHSPH